MSTVRCWSRTEWQPLQQWSEGISVWLGGAGQAGHDDGTGYRSSVGCVGDQPFELLAGHRVDGAAFFVADAGEVGDMHVADE